MRPGELARILDVCRDAYGEDLGPVFRTFRDAVHVVGYEGAELVSHALWITRWLQVEGAPPMRTAYVEAVATSPTHQRRGHASAILRRLAPTVSHMELAALCPSDAGQSLYAGLGWEPWHGPLFIRTDDGLLPTPEERIMILRLPGTPPLDTHAPISAEWREDELW